MANRAQLLVSYLFFALVLVVGLPTMALVRVVTAPFDRQRLVVGRLFRIIGNIISGGFPPWQLRVLDVPKLEKGRRYVIVANHESILDCFLLSRLPWEMKWLAKASAFRIPLIGRMLQLAGDIPVVRGDKDSGAQALERARRYVEHGMPVMVFPEGTRSKDGSVLPFKPGAFRLAIDTSATIIPIAVYGTAAGMPVGSPWVRPTQAWARVLPAVSTEGLGPEDVERLCGQVQQAISAERDKLCRMKQTGTEGASSVRAVLGS